MERNRKHRFAGDDRLRAGSHWKIKAPLRRSLDGNNFLSGDDKRTADVWLKDYQQSIARASCLHAQREVALRHLARDLLVQHANVS